MGGIEKEDEEYWAVSAELSRKGLRILRFEGRNTPLHCQKRAATRAWGKEGGKKRVGAASTDGGSGAGTKDRLLRRSR